MKVMIWHIQNMGNHNQLNLIQFPVIKECDEQDEKEKTFS